MASAGPDVGLAVRERGLQLLQAEADSLQEAGDLTGARGLLRRALEQRRSAPLLGSASQVADMENRLGVLEHAAGNHEEARRLQTSAFHTFQDTEGDCREAVVAAANVAHDCYELEDFDGLLQWIQRACELAQRSGHLVDISPWLFAKAVFFADLNEADCSPTVKVGL